MFKNAIVRKPCPSITDGLTTANLGKPNFEKALFAGMDNSSAMQKTYDKAAEVIIGIEEEIGV